MVRKSIVYLLLILPFWSFGQSDTLQKLESELMNAQGTAKITKRIALSELYYKRGQIEKAASTAEEAFKRANYEGNRRLMALALNRGAKASLAEGNNRKARKDLWDSVQLIDGGEDPDLLKENLSILRTIAKKTARNSELLEIEQRIAAVQTMEAPPQRTGGVGESQPQKPVDLLGALESATRELSTQVTDLHSKNEQLERNLLSRQREIEAMTQQQMEQELMLALQQNMLDSLSLRGLRDSLLLTQQDLQLQEQVAQLQQQRYQRYLFLGLVGLAGLIALSLFTRYRSMKQYNATLKEKNHIILEEQKRSEELLLNILPAAIAQELKSNGAAQARHYDQATVLFTDFQGFSKIAKGMTPEQLVSELDYCFKNFDRIVEKYNLEKIKTIGDAYMCAGGLPLPSSSHPVNVVLAAIEIQQFLREWKLQKVERGEPYFEARLGIHTGPIVAGVVGNKKFAYDIWGDTVNVAARMESSCETGKINISESTYELIKDTFLCSYRGKVPAKGMGEIDMYYVEKPAAITEAVPA